MKNLNMTYALAIAMFVAAPSFACYKGSAESNPNSKQDAILRSLSNKKMYCGLNSNRGKLALISSANLTYIPKHRCPNSPLIGVLKFPFVGVSAEIDNIESLVGSNRGRKTINITFDVRKTTGMKNIVRGTCILDD